MCSFHYTSCVLVKNYVRPYEYILKVVLSLWTMIIESKAINYSVESQDFDLHGGQMLDIEFIPVNVAFVTVSLICVVVQLWLNESISIEFAAGMLFCVTFYLTLTWLTVAYIYVHSKMVTY